MLSPNTPYPFEKFSKQLIFLNNFITKPNIEIGDYTYYHGRVRPEKFENENVLFGLYSKLIIGKFCQIADGTKSILSDANHQIDRFSTYPFYLFGKMAEGCAE